MDENILWERHSSLENEVNAAESVAPCGRSASMPRRCGATWREAKKKRGEDITGKATPPLAKFAFGRHTSTHRMPRSSDASPLMCGAA